MIQKIEDFIAKENYKVAFEQVEKALLKDEDNIELLSLKAMIYKKLGRFSEAINLYNSILEKYPDNKKVEVERDLIRNSLLLNNIDIFDCTNLYDDPWF